MYNDQSSELDNIHQPGIKQAVQASIHHSQREKNPDLHKCGFNPIISLVEHVTVFISLIMMLRYSLSEEEDHDCLYLYHLTL